LKIFATGTSGVIGSRLMGVIPVYLDLSKTNDYSGLLLDSNSTLIHLAGIVGESKVQANKELARKVNVDGTVELARTILSKSNSRLIFVSSSHVYLHSSSPLKEDDEVGPFSLYGQLKLEAENLLKEVFADEPSRLCIARVFSVLDSGMPEGSLGWAIENLSVRAPLYNCDDERDFQTPKEIAEVLIRLAKSAVASGVINICSGESKSVRNACIELRERLGLPTDSDLLKDGYSKVPRIVGDRTKLNKFLLR
jgi:dTDP-4-dehydrorhamnose reductase